LTDTLSPLREFDPVKDAELLKEEKTFLQGPDDFAQYTAPRFVVKRVVLPDWMEPAEWCRAEVEWRYLWAVVPAEWPEQWQRALMLVNERAGMPTLLAITELLKTKEFRSPFRKSLRDQIVEWMETPEEDRKYRLPLSQRQINSILSYAIVVKARCIESRVYSDPQRFGIPA
jgi:hypothetical protein